jgi:uncharacterized protein
VAKQEQRHQSSGEVRPTLEIAANNETRAIRWLNGPCVPSLVLGLGLFLCTACGHAARTEEARSALDVGDAERALALYNEELDVDSKADLPSDPGADDTLLVLDRSMILQQLSDYKLSARDLEYADKQIEVLDFTRSTVDDISRYIFSDDSGEYKAPPYEKLMINTMNMVNYLVRGDLNGAKIEARRFTVMQDYLQQSESAQAAMLGAGSYLAGFIFEHSNEPQTALRYYDEALQYETFSTLRSPIVRLASKANYRTPRLQAIIDAKKATDDADDKDSAELLVVLNYGRVPAKVALRLPVGLALVRAGSHVRPFDANRANSLAAQGLVTWVNFPTLGKPRGSRQSAGVEVDDRSLPLDGVALDSLAVKAWNEGEGAVIASAITRMISRVVAGQVANKVGGNDGVGLLLSLATQASLTAADTPDTRSWATLPARMSFTRLRVPAGQHQIKMQVGSRTLERTLNLKPGGWAALNLTVLR